MPLTSLTKMRLDYTTDLNAKELVHLFRMYGNIRFLNDVIIRELEQPQVMWLEDISTKWLEDRYNVILKTPPPQPFKTLDYKVYFKPEDMAIIKEKFKERFDAEFQFFGYEYK